MDMHKLLSLLFTKVLLFIYIHILYENRFTLGEKALCNGSSEDLNNIFDFKSSFKSKYLKLLNIG